MKWRSRRTVSPRAPASPACASATPSYRKELKYDDGTPVSKDWNRVMTTIFNGASNIVQRGGLAALDEVGLEEMRSDRRLLQGKRSAH